MKIRNNNAIGKTENAKSQKPPGVSNGAPTGWKYLVKPVLLFHLTVGSVISKNKNVLPVIGKTSI